MNKAQVIKHFGSQKAVAAALEISQPAVAQWGDLVPEKQALRLHMLTSGQLHYDPSVYAQRASKAA